jgi:hypothetical protein
MPDGHVPQVQSNPLSDEESHGIEAPVQVHAPGLPVQVIPLGQSADPQSGAMPQ